MAKRYNVEIHGVGTHRCRSIREAVEHALARERTHDCDLHVKIIDTRTSAVMYEGFAYMAPHWLKENHPVEHAKLVTPGDAMRLSIAKAYAQVVDGTEYIRVTCLPGDRRPPPVTGSQWALEALVPRKAVDAADVFTVHFSIPFVYKGSHGYLFHTGFVVMSPTEQAGVPKEWLEMDGETLRIKMPHAEVAWQCLDSKGLMVQDLD